MSLARRRASHPYFGRAGCKRNRADEQIRCDAPGHQADGRSGVSQLSDDGLQRRDRAAASGERDIREKALRLDHRGTGRQAGCRIQRHRRRGPFLREQCADRGLYRRLLGRRRRSAVGKEAAVVDPEEPAPWRPYRQRRRRRVLSRPRRPARRLRLHAPLAKPAGVRRSLPPYSAGAPHLRHRPEQVHVRGRRRRLRHDARTDRVASWRCAVAEGRRMVRA